MVKNEHKTYNIILAAGKRLARDRATALTQSDSLTLVNGRPVISWVVQNLMNSAEGPIILVCRSDDKELISFAQTRWKQRADFHLATLDDSSTILMSLQAGLDKATEADLSNRSLRIMLGDTILLDDEPFHGDRFYVADFEHDSRSWCVVPQEQSSENLIFHDKEPNLKSPQYKALVGCYELSDGRLLSQCVTDALKDDETELSAVLSLYHESRPIKPFEISQTSWIDCGHLEGLAIAKQKLIISRHFNSFEIDPILPIITKKSTDAQKLAQEVFWYEALPDELQALTPRILSVSDHQIKMEYYGYGNLAEKFIYYDLPHNFWNYILNKLFDIVDQFQAKYSSQKSFYQPLAEEVNFENIYVDKMFSRIETFKQQDSFWSSVWDYEFIEINCKRYTNIAAMMPRLTSRVRELSKTPKLSIVHGDLCFNNILFDISSGVIKLIDPRGKFGTENNSILGDSRYDIAKIRHSYCGNYDSLIERDFTLEKLDLDKYTFSTYKAGHSEREMYFDELTREYGYCTKDIRLIEALHFLTMIPLHRDSRERQIAIWLTAIIKLNCALFNHEEI